MSESKSPVEVPAVVEKRKNVQVAATVTAVEFDGLNEFAFSRQVKMQDVIKVAVSEFISNRGIRADGTAPRHDAVKDI